jgi:hypothetical protein
MGPKSTTRLLSLPEGPRSHPTDVGLSSLACPGTVLTLPKRLAEPARRQMTLMLDIPWTVLR